MSTSKTTKIPKAATKKTVKVPGLKFKTVDDYIATLPPATKKILKEMKKVIKEAAPQAEEKISYNIPSFHFNGVLVYFAAWREHVSIYPKSALMEKAIPELAKYEGGKGTVQFPLDKPVPYGIIKKFVKFKLEEKLSKIKKTKKASSSNKAITTDLKAPHGGWPEKKN
jgi:uncharacterized protein YdhG (YjbR/CyaY superfamily)